MGMNPSNQTPAEAEVGSPLIDLHHEGEEQVMVFPRDYDVFLMTQGEAVKALSEKHQMVEQAAEAQKMVNELFMDIAHWGNDRTEGIERILWAPRLDDVLIAVIAENEDEEGELHDEMAELELTLVRKYGFRLRFLLLRASEKEGLGSFVDPKDARRICGAKS